MGFPSSFPWRAFFLSIARLPPSPGIPHFQPQPGEHTSAFQQAVNALAWRIICGCCLHNGRGIALSRRQSQAERGRRCPQTSEPKPTQSHFCGRPGSTTRMSRPGGPMGIPISAEGSLPLSALCLFLSFPSYNKKAGTISRRAHKPFSFIEREREREVRLVGSEEEAQGRNAEGRQGKERTQGGGWLSGPWCSPHPQGPARAPCCSHSLPPPSGGYRLHPGYCLWYSCL